MTFQKIIRINWQIIIIVYNLFKYTPISVSQKFLRILNIWNAELTISFNQWLLVLFDHHL